MIKQKGDHNLEDQISQFPDEILVHTLSFLTIKEATVTSVLSSRWTNLWTHHARLDFDATETIRKLYCKDDKFLETERLRYVQWVNQVVQLYSGSTIEEFRVCFDLDESWEYDVNEWLKFALAKRLQRLELDLTCTKRITHQKPYTFSYQLLDQSKGTWKEVLDQSKGTTFVGFNYLKAIILKGVNVSGEVLEYFLSRCRVLEQMVVDSSIELVNLKVVGPSLVLKRLEIFNCPRIESFEIRNVNLVFLTYMGRQISFLLENVPMLVEVYISGPTSGSLTDVFAQLACCLSQLETLTLHTSLIEATTEFDVSTELTNLKKFVLDNSIWFHDNRLLHYTSLIKAAPHLKKLVLQIQWYHSPHICRRKFRRAEKCVHPCLEEVEFLGYYGRTSHLELVVYLLENAIALKRLIIDPRDQRDPGFPVSQKNFWREKAATIRAKEQFEGKVPAGVELVIVDRLVGRKWSPYMSEN